MDEISQQISDELLELEPQVTSSDPNERKLARRLRIERRLLALRRQSLSEHVDTTEVKDKTLTQIQIEKSIEVLKKLLTEGDERVTNVRVANDAREVDRREAEGVNREKIIQALEEEGRLADEAFQHISDKWLSILKSNDPLNINDRMLQQKEKCEELMKQKDGIISMLKEEIASAEKKFSNDQKKQIDDIVILSDRIEKQIALTRRAYREQLKLIEESMNTERKIMMEMNARKWDELHKKRDQEEQLNSDKKYEQMELFDNEMVELRRSFQEKYRETKIKLERDIDDLEQELERIKALAILNSEKLDYNYQILKKREDENIIIKSQQKRRINKLQDIVNTLKRKISEYGEETKQQIVKVTVEISKLQKNILDIESKADHFAEINDTKFNQLWEMNIERVMEVAKRILTIDKILHEQLLGIEWIDTGALKRKELTKENLPSYQEAVTILQQEAKALLPHKSVKLLKSKRASILMDPKKQAVREGILRRLMLQIADKAGFILEDRLQLILKPFLETEKTLVRMDNVFAALNITKDADIDELMEYFLPYTHCPMCTYGERPERLSICSDETELLVHQLSISSEQDVRSVSFYASATSVASTSEEKRSIDRRDRMTQNLIPVSHLPAPMINSVMNEVLECKSEKSVDSDSELEALVAYEGLDPLENMPPARQGASLQEAEHDSTIDVSLSEHVITVEEKLSCQYQHPLVISSVYVLKALRHFVNNYFTQKAGLPTIGERLERQRNTICRLVEENDIKMFWEQFKNIFSEENENLWNALYDGLIRYHSILKDRKMLHDDVVDLRKQNNDLKILLGKYLEDPNSTTLVPPCALQKKYPQHVVKSKKR